MADNNALRPMRLPKMAELIADRLRRQIIRGELREGDTLPSESELLARFKVSRPTLREAFRILEAEALITVRRGAHGGARVQVPNLAVAARYAGLILGHGMTSLADVYDARIVLEPPVVRLLAAQATEQDVARLRAALDEHEAAAYDPRRSLQLHTAFHALLVELAGNQTLEVLAGMVWHILDVANFEHLELQAGSPDALSADRGAGNAHRRVVDLIEAGGQAGAEELWRKHLVEAREYLLRGNLKSVVDVLGRGAPEPGSTS